MFRNFLTFSTPLLLAVAAFAEATAEDSNRELRELTSFPAAEAHQGVAVDEGNFYAIANRSIGRYDRQTGDLVAQWKASGDTNIKHLNSGVVIDGRLYCAHSNWPETPLQNSVEIWNVETLKHVGQKTFAENNAAITWVDQKDGQWWGAFAHYGESEQVLGSYVARFDKDWDTNQTWTFPPAVVERFVPYSCSGGAWGDDGLLYTTGHDRTEVYVLKIPDEGTQLELVDTLSAPVAGQGIAWDRSEPGVLYGIRRKQKQVVVSRLAEAISTEVKKWLGPQAWERDTPGPLLSLGKPGMFDDTHIFAPCIAFEKDKYWLWYCGSTGRVAERVFSLGLATSEDGKTFERFSTDPVYSFGDGKYSVLTPTLLRDATGNVLREDGKLRMWFSATHFASESSLHWLHQTTSTDGVHWTAPSRVQLKHVYAPTILKENESYRMWYVDVSQTPWIVRYAESADGRQWQVRRQPVLTIDQPWEHERLFYPTVVKADRAYLMWYGSYWNGHPQHTALGFAVSSDGIKWHKHPQNPVLKPNPNRPWESHYTTSQSVLRLADGSWRIWYASRKAPPFVNKYFAVNTAHWPGPEQSQPTATNE